MPKSPEEMATESAKLIAGTFLTSLLSEKALTRLEESYPNVESQKLAQEWFALQFFLMVAALASHYADDAKGIAVGKHFRAWAIEGLVEAGVYRSTEGATEFIKERLGVYDEALSQHENPLLKVSLAFLKFLEQEDGALVAGTGHQIAAFLKSNQELVREADSRR